MRMDRRQFLGSAASAAVAQSGILGAQADKPVSHFNAIQMGPHSLCDEGIDHALDLIQDTAAINTVMVYSHMYHGGYGKALPVFAPDHGVTPRDTRNRKLPMVWVKHHDRYFKDTSLRHPVADASVEYSDRDLFKEMLPAIRKRGMKLYARILEGSGRDASDRILNYTKVETRDINGKTSSVPCWNHPEYRAWWMATVEDMFQSYELDGLQWGAERQGPLMNAIMPWNNNPPICFCEFCRARGKANGIDAERARLGFEKLYNYVQGLMSGKSKPADGVFAGFLGVLIRYPEILSWEYQYRQAREDMQRAIYKTVKAIKPEAQVGWHVDHQPSSWDIVYRAEMSYAEMAPYSDFIKFIAYHAVLGPRIRSWYLARLQHTVLSELSLKESLDLYYDIFGYDKTKEPGVDQLATAGFDEDYVFRETKRSVASAEGKTKIYTGIGFDVPGEPGPANPERVYQCVKKAFEGGGAGIVVSREYEEMRVPNLKAVGRAMREL
jgi:hypothetical protein